MLTGLTALGRVSVVFILTVKPSIGNTSVLENVTFTVTLTLSLIHLKPYAWVPCGECLLLSPGLTLY